MVSTEADSYKAYNDESLTHKKDRYTRSAFKLSKNDSMLIIGTTGNGNNKDDIKSLSSIQQYEVGQPKLLASTIEPAIGEASKIPLRANAKVKKARAVTPQLEENEEKVRKML